MTQTNEDDVDPNAPTNRQLKLKSVEMQVRRKGDGELVMQLDALAAISDKGQAIDGIQKLMAQLNG
ncbi:hypothetical protein [Cupriavidus pampae]|uniref:Uncharacterized protein n=1 Tax=Cupriavidus pampae TaxID=659251 RepID=A0ABN7ZJH1_9BURK|nr:hypothetical protein [Cupriavidus pampae]CAG9184182.1 hypothetical protein LMG32289_05551 [Cupriavidus pampae]